MTLRLRSVYSLGTIVLFLTVLACIAPASAQEEGAAAAAAQSDEGGRLASRYRVVPLELGRGDDARALRVNSQGIVVGYEHTAQGTACCVWKEGKLVGRLSGKDGMVQGVNEKGQFAGGLGIDEVTPFVGDIDQVRPLEGSWRYVATIAADVNDKGEVAGIAIDPLRGPQAVLFVDGSVRELGSLGGGSAEANAIGPAGQVVGESAGAWSDEHAFLWENGRMIDLGTLGGEQSAAQDINDTGLIVGMAENGEGYTRACVWEKRKIRDLGALPGGSHSWAFGCNRHGQVCGWSQVINDQQHGTLWHQGRAIDLNDLIEESDTWTITDARGIADDGSIAAQAERNGQSRPVLLVPVFDASPAAGVADAPAAVPAGGGDWSDWPSRRPMGRWIDETTYVNSFVTPFRVKLPDGWRNEKPAGEAGLHVINRNSEFATDPRVEIDPDEVVKAFVLWSVREEIDPIDAWMTRTYLGIEIEAIPAGQSFDECVAAGIRRRVEENRGRAENRIDPLVRTGEVWLDGRRCRVFDFDGFYVMRTFCTRIYFVEAGRHVVSFGWTVTESRDRARLAALMEEMVELGPPLAPGQKADAEALGLHRAVCRALDAAAREPALAESLSAIRDKEETQLLSIAQAMDAVERLADGTSSSRIRDFGVASAARDMAEQAQREIANLRLDADARLLEAAWGHLTPEEQTLARKLRPDVVPEGAKTPMGEPAAERAAAQAGWVTFKHPEVALWVDMPGKPKRSEDGMAYDFALTDPDAVFTVVYGKIGDELEQIQNQPQLLEQLITVLSQSTVQHIGDNGGELIGSRPITFDGRAGRECRWTFEREGARQVGCFRFFVVEKGFAAVGVTHAAGADFAAQEKAFLDSARTQEQRRPSDASLPAAPVATPAP